MFWELKIKENETTFLKTPLLVFRTVQKGTPRLKLCPPPRRSFAKWQWDSLKYAAAVSIPPGLFTRRLCIALVKNWNYGVGRVASSDITSVSYTFLHGGHKKMIFFISQGTRNYKKTFKLLMWCLCLATGVAPVEQYETNTCGVPLNSP